MLIETTKYYSSLHADIFSTKSKECIIKATRRPVQLEMGRVGQRTTTSLLVVEYSISFVSTIVSSRGFVTLQSYAASYTARRCQGRTACCISTSIDDYPQLYLLSSLYSRSKCTKMTRSPVQIGEARTGLSSIRLSSPQISFPFKA